MAGFYYAVSRRVSEASLFISNEMNSNVFEGGMNWNWREFWAMLMQHGKQLPGTELVKLKDRTAVVTGGRFTQM